MFNSETYRIPDWSAGLSLEGEQYVHVQAYDALNRSVSEVTGRSGMAMSRVLYGYNESGLLNAVRADASGTGMEDYVREISYNEQGQRTLISYGNGSETRYRYDRATFRMLSLITRGSPGKLQDFHYSYDAVGNISEIHNASEDTLYFNNQEVSASNDYEYDSLYRLIYATGREHIGQLGVHANTPDSQGDEFRVNLPHPGDGNALQGYRQHYSYDGVGNMLLLRHIGGLGSMTHRWSRVFRYNNNEADRDVLGIPAGTKKNNQLLRSESGGLVSNYSYDVHGNMAGLQEGSYRVSWSSMDRLKYVELPGGTSHYWYSIEGVRTRKVLTDGEKIGKERIYYGNLEVYREYTSTGSVRMERESYHVVDDTSRIALVEHKTIDHPSDSSATELLRYQYGNHLGSSSLELDAGGRIISYEEYYAYGTTSYQAQHAGIRSASKRYRYTGMERDEESGLSYHNARYYLPWLARWLNPDPIGIEGGINLFEYTASNPITFIDPTGNKLVEHKGNIGGFSEKELNDAIKTVYGEISAKIHPDLEKEAKAVASTIFNRLEDIKKTRKEYEKTSKEYKKAKAKVTKEKKDVDAANKEYEELTKNESKNKSAIRKELKGKYKDSKEREKEVEKEYKSRVKKAKDKIKKEKKELRNAEKELKAKYKLFETARDNKIASESYIKESKRSNTKVTLSDIVEQHSQYEGTRKGKEDFKKFPQMSKGAQARHEKRFEVAKKAVIDLAKGGTKDPYVQFRSNRGGKRILKKGQVRIGGNDFWK